MNKYRIINVSFCSAIMFMGSMTNSVSCNQCELEFINTSWLAMKTSKEVILIPINNIKRVITQENGKV